MNAGDTLLRFKFKFVDDNGDEEGLFSKKGSFDGETLVLGKDEIPVILILKVERKFNRLILEVLQEGGQLVYLVVAVTGGNLERLLSSINRVSSAKWAEMQREELAKKGEGHLFRGEICPSCSSTLVVSRFPVTPQIYCSFCDTISTLDARAPKGEKDFRLCDCCQLYSKPRIFSSFYFYFLLVVYGWRSQKRYMCHSCMRKEAWKMLAGNFIFILGVPAAICQLVRAYRGGNLGSPDFAGLDAANTALKKGNFHKSHQLYENILRRVPYAAGIRYNIGLGCMNHDNLFGAIEAHEAALRDCSNYAPAANALAACYTKAGEEAKLAGLKRLWDEEEAAEVA